ncbi:hypothetical protein A3K63_04255 [Candidatus Micrarchaeota archaeon RBG_16_49_10]|nr:MAG: hypothetical protein A3K63_04255 [Candidatus Micrarchaeota archaeon RBG_16_49_10]
MDSEMDKYLEDGLYEEEEGKVGGFNPLFLASILVVVTILIAAGLSFWATDISDKKSSLESGKCSGSISLYSGSFDGSKGEVTMVIDNKGASLGELKLYLEYENGEVGELRTPTVLVANSFQTVNFGNVAQSFKKGVLKTECSSIELKFIQESGILKSG